MRDDDEIIQAYESQFDADSEPPKRSNRGFWLVVGTLALACVVLVVEIFANRPIANDIGRTQHALRQAQSRAETVATETGSFVEADAAGLNRRWPGDGLTYVGADVASTGQSEVSISASDSVWAAAVRIRPDACFYLRLGSGEEARYGVGTVCTATEALGAQDDRW